MARFVYPGSTKRTILKPLPSAALANSASATGQRDHHPDGHVHPHRKCQHRCHRGHARFGATGFWCRGEGFVPICPENPQKWGLNSPFKRAKKKRSKFWALCLFVS